MTEGLGLIRRHDPGSKNSQWRAGYARRVWPVYQDALFHPSLTAESSHGRTIYDGVAAPSGGRQALRTEQSVGNLSCGVRKRR